MEPIELYKIDEVFGKIVTSPHIENELSDYFKFRVPGFQFMSAYKNRMWDGYIRLYNSKNKQIYLGLADQIQHFAKQRGYFFANKTEKPEHFSEERIEEFLRSLNVYSDNNPLKHRDYQVNSIIECIQNHRKIIISSTGSGKSLVIYSLVRFYQNLIKSDEKILLVVPTTSLVEQMYSDFADYSSRNGWKVEENCHRIYGGKEKDCFQQVVITTWQSIYKLPKGRFKQYRVVIGDECHKFQSGKAVQSLFEKTYCAQFRFGTTGTLDDSKIHHLVLEGLFGSSFKATTTKELMDKKQLASLNIVCPILKYSEQERMDMKGAKYQEEVNFIINHPKRLTFTKNLALGLNGNSLILFRYVETHGKIIYDLIKEHADPERKIFFVSGNVNTDVREKIRQEVEKSENAIIVASIGTFSTGINIKNIHNVIFTTPSKSSIQILQSIGRGLRKSPTKNSMTLYDIVDDLQYKNKENYLLKHFIFRSQVYNDEEFIFKTIPIELSPPPQRALNV